MKVADLFAGLGGFTVGAFLAGLTVVFAANHWPVAVDTHSLNHPQVLHSCQDLHQQNWSRLPQYDILTASPCCQGHFPNNAFLSSHDNSRSTAWAVVSALEYSRAPLAVVENIPGFLNWTLYKAWVMALESLGYTVSVNVLDAADSGVPQHRKRLFLVLTRSKAPLVLNVEKKDHKPVRDCIDWEGYEWSPVLKPGRALATMERAQRGRLELGERFVMPYYSSGSGKMGRSIDRPLGAVTTRDRWAVVQGWEMRMMQVREYVKVMSFPGDYKLPASKKLAVHLLGNAVPPLMAKDVLEAVVKAA